MESKLKYALELLSQDVLKALSGFSELEEADEIRLRLSRRLCVSLKDKDCVLDYICTQADIEHSFKTAFSYSMHSYSRELSQGYITTRGGNRVGISGTAVISQGGEGIEAVKYITSLNVRIAREIIGCADEIVSECFKSGPEGLIIAGPPGSGKTTLLRDISRQLGARYKISLIDERGEISSAHKGSAQNGVGEMTDIFYGYPKAIGIETAVRVMTPRALIVDEIGSESDGKALSYAVNSGVKIITAVHAGNLSEAMKKTAIRSLYESGAFGFSAELDSSRRAAVKRLD